MKKAGLAVVLVLALAGFTAAQTFQNSTTQKVLQNREKYVELYNSNLDRVPDVLRSLVSGERINLYLETSQGNRTLGIVMDGGKIGRVVEGEIQNPTLEVYTDFNTTERILDAEKPPKKAVEAYNQGEIRYRTTNLGTRIKMAVITFFAEVFGFVL